MKKPESLPVRVVRDPFIWGGVGLLIRYVDDPSAKGMFWKAAGIIAIGIGVATAVANQQTAVTTLDTY